MSASRLVSVLVALQTRGRVTARELAAELEVSEKTARRDLEALGAAGFPVYSQAGRGGGWQLLGGGRTDLTGLTVPEVRALFVVAGASVSVTPEARSALRKLVRALPESFRSDAEAAATAVVVDTSRWGGRSPGLAPPMLAEIERAVIERRQIVLGYRDRARRETTRTVHPLGLVSKGDVWYLVADTAAGMRTFRVSRVASIEVTDLEALRPDGFDLSAAWDAVAANVAELRTRVRALVRVDRSVVWSLRHQFDSDMTLTEIASDGDGDGDASDRAADRVLVVIGGGSVEMIAGHLAGWGASVEVVEPVALRHELGRIAAELVAMYRHPPESGADVALDVTSAPDSSGF